MSADACARTADQLDSSKDAGCLQTYERRLREAPDTSVETFLYDRPLADRSQLVGLVAIELRHRWQRGQRPDVESYLRRFPELRRDRERLIDLIYAEYCARRRLGEPCDVNEYRRRFPDCAQSLGRLFRIHSLFASNSAALRWALDRMVELPNAGERFLDFDLVRELGRGGFGRVFLARQRNLGNRLVAVKITPTRTIEAQTLARLEHPNIVPVYSVHRDQSRDLQAVCMPYLAATSLNDVQARWADQPTVPTQAASLIEAVRERVPPDLRRPGTAEHRHRFPEQADYCAGCAWLMWRVAEALAHAHSRGVCHRDLKPSNVLLTVWGQPLLVDFNLAFNLVETDGDRGAFFGGTLPYMSPEQLAALDDEEPGTPDDVGPTSDIFSLGATFFHLLTGRHPFRLPDASVDHLSQVRQQLRQRRHGPPSARQLNPAVPPELDAILAKCMSCARHLRYQSAAQLGEDLERHLDRWAILRAVRPCRGLATLNLLRGGPLWVAATSVLLAALGVGSMALTRLVQRRAPKVLAEPSAAVASEAGAAGPALRACQAAFVAYRAERYGEAGRLFREALRLGCRTPRVYYYRGKCLALEGDLSESLAAYAAALELDPGYAYAYIGKALVLAESQRHRDLQQALQDAERGIRLAARQPRFAEQRVPLIANGFRVFLSAVRGEPSDAALWNRAEELLLLCLEQGVSPAALAGESELRPLLARPRIARFLARQGGGRVAKND